MSDPDRLSAARHVEGLSSKPSVLDQQEQSNSAFNQAAQTAQQPEAQQGRGSEMVEKDGSRHNSRPPEDMARGQDAKSFNQAWTGEQRAAARAEQLKERYKATQTTEAQSDAQSLNQRPGQRM